ncbi:MAG: aromatic amino acid lyase [Bacteroidales bacterium]|nr:aromatic amino acid lyase [Bacteroidales bacterium]
MIDIELIESILFREAPMSISDEEWNGIDECYKFLEDFRRDKVIYGINTGFGPMAQYRVSEENLRKLQYNIVRSHSTGAGAPLDVNVVRAAMISRIGTFLQFRSGIHRDVVAQLVSYVNKGITPYVPQHGSVGASGDLVQLAHIALTLIGEGKVFYKGNLVDTQEALKAEGFKAVELHGRDGLSVVNGTAVMTGLGLVTLIESKRLLEWMIAASAMVNEVVESYDDMFSEQLNGVRRQEGQQEVARMLREFTQGATLLRKREATLYAGNDETYFSHKVQPFYSLRCVPQILGPVLEVLRNVERILINEVNSADDNPIVDPVSKSVYHGGNFHGDYISMEMDKLKIAMTKAIMLSERQLNYLLHDKINETLPPFCNLGTLGLDYGMQACQFTATSTTAECQTLANPMSVHSIPNNNDNQDIVSMGTNSAIIARRVISNGYQVVSILLMTIAQAVDCLKVADKLSARSRDCYDRIRTIFPIFTEDHPHYDEVAAIEAMIRKNGLDILTAKSLSI